MAQTFNPEHVLLKDTLGEDFQFQGFTNEFAEGLVSQSLVTRFGERIDMGNQYIKDVGGNELGELSDAYIVGEGEKIGTATVEPTEGYRLETKKVSVILPATSEALNYSWARYFDDMRPAIVDKFAKIIDSGTFFGNYRGATDVNPFGPNVLEQAVAAGNVVNGDLGTLKGEEAIGALMDLETMTDVDPTHYFGHRSLERSLRGIVDPVANERIFERDGYFNGLNYEKIILPNEDTYPEGTLILGDPKGIKYGLPLGAGLRLMSSNEATLSKVQNVSPDTGDFHLFEQDSAAVRAIFEIAIAVPNGNNFAVLQPDVAGV